MTALSEVRIDPTVLTTCSATFSAAVKAYDTMPDDEKGVVGGVYDLMLRSFVTGMRDRTSMLGHHVKLVDVKLIRQEVNERTTSIEIACSAVDDNATLLLHNLTVKVVLANNLLRERTSLTKRLEAIRTVIERGLSGCMTTPSDMDAFINAQRRLFRTDVVKVPQYRCDTCGKTYTSATKLIAHIDATDHVDSIKSQYWYPKVKGNNDVKNDEGTGDQTHG